MNEVPLYYGEGPDRVKIGTAEVDGNEVQFIINDPKFSRMLDTDLQNFSIYVPSIRPTDSVTWLAKPIYKETPVADYNTPTSSITNAQKKAIDIVFAYAKNHMDVTDTHVTFAVDEVYVVWFCKTLQNWKALVSTTLPDGMYYEVTYNGDKGETYLDAYKKFDNVCIKDEVAPTQDPLPVSFAREQFLAGEKHPDNITDQPYLYPIEWQVPPKYVQEGNTVSLLKATKDAFIERLRQGDGNPGNPYAHFEEK
jgi:hypothetical protein